MGRGRWMADPFVAGPWVVGVHHTTLPAPTVPMGVARVATMAAVVWTLSWFEADHTHIHSFQHGVFFSV
jgi:hypothetical protein